jgi:hypothetical protein
MMSHILLNINQKNVPRNMKRKCGTNIHGIEQQLIVLSTKPQLAQKYCPNVSNLPPHAEQLLLE